MRPERITPGPGQESVWDYPRPPRLEDCSRSIQVIFNGVILAETHRSKRVLETSHPPVYYIPPEDIQQQYLVRLPRSSWCEWKGEAGYYRVVVNDLQVENAAWFYPRPTPAFQTMQNYVAFYAHLMDDCRVDGQSVTPQPGNFYGGWITPEIVGPFKGGPGTWGW